MEKILAFNLNEDKLKSLYKICSQMKIMVIEVPKSEMLTPLKKMMELKAYKGGAVSSAVAANVTSDTTQPETMIVMCDVTDKHVDKILAMLRMTGTTIDYKALLTPVNKDWNGLRMFTQMAAEKRAIEG